MHIVLKSQESKNQIGIQTQELQSKRCHFDRGLRVQLRLVKLLQGVYSYFVTGKPGFDLNRTMGKEGEVKYVEF